MENDKLLNFINGKVTVAQQQEVLDWINSDPANKSKFAQLKNINTAAEIHSVKNNNHLNTIKRISIWGCKIAAVLIIGYTLFHIGKNEEANKWIKNSAEQITEIKAPLGESVHLTLPDGSSIKLNSGSVMRFSNLYGYENRSVQLDGEGYFEIVKSNLEFIVETSDINVAVLGTTFNISAYSTDRVVYANLYEGSIEINNNSIKEKLILKPSEKYSYDRLTKKSSYKSFNKEYNWLDNYFVANSDDIEEFVNKIKRKYNVKIFVSPDLKGKCKYTGVFKGESLTEILDNMVLASPINYFIDKSGAVHIKYDNH